MRPVALLTRQWPQEAHKALSEHCETRFLMPATDLSAEFFRAFNKDVNILCTSFLDRVDPELIRSLSGLKLIAHFGRWPVSSVSPSTVSSSGLIASDTGDAAAEEIADYALTLLLAVTRRMTQPLHTSEAQRTLDQELGFSLRGRTVGFLGFDASALELVKRLAALGIDSIYSAVKPDPDADAANLKYFDSPSTVLDIADAVSLHHGTYRLDQNLLGHCRPDSVILNLTDPDLIDEPALAQALKDRRIAGAGLDVWRDTLLLQNCPNTLLTPRLATNTLRARLEMAYRVVENIKIFLSTGDVIDRVDLTGNTHSA